MLIYQRVNQGLTPPRKHSLTHWHQGHGDAPSTKGGGALSDYGLRFSVFNAPSKLAWVVLDLCDLCIDELGSHQLEVFTSIVASPPFYYK